ncbi:MAG: pentapeptide repeat-containing protein, partial [Ktedonobacterales bacterium]
MGEVDASKRVLPNGFASWPDYWQAQGMLWRTEPEIDAERQRYLAERRAVKPDIKKGIYSFRDENGRITLTRADVEWLLATHESGGMHGPIKWTDEKQRGRDGLDVRGADLSDVDLHKLPLARLRGSLTFEEAFPDDSDRVDAAAVSLARTNLRRAHLEGAWLRRVHLDGADLRSARLAKAELYNAFLIGTRLEKSYLARTSLRRAVLSADTNLY